MALGLIGGIGLLLCALGLWRVVVGAASGALSRNAAVGIRTSATQASDAAWHAGHQAAVTPARLLALVCSALAVAMMVASLVGGSADPTALVVVLFAGGYLTMFAGCVVVARAANRGARGVTP